MVAMKSIDTKLKAAQGAIDNACADASIQANLSAYGYTAERLEDGRSLYQKALADRQERRASLGAQLGTTDRFTGAQKQAYAEYIRQVKVARICFAGDREARKALELIGARKQTLAGLIGQMKAFYTNALASEAVVQALSA